MLLAVLFKVLAIRLAVFYIVVVSTAVLVIMLAVMLVSVIAVC